MKKRVLSMFMALALCLTLLPAPVRAAEDTPESGAIVQQERQERQTQRPPYPNRLERMRKRTVQRVTRKIPVPLTPVALRTVKQMRRRAARMKTPGTMRTRRYPLCRR